MKRSNRLVLLIGALLAVVAFVGIVLLLGQPTNGPGNQQQATPPTTVTRVFAKVDIPLGTSLTADMLESRVIEIGNAAGNSVPDPSLIISQVIRREAKAGTQLTYDFFTSTTNANLSTNLPQGLRAIAVQVDQVTGVGTLIQTGDTVDVIIGFKIQQVAQGRNAQNKPDPNQIINVGAPQPSVKMIIQNLRVVGTLLPPATGAVAQPQQPAPSGSPAAGPPQQPATTLNGQQEIVIVAATANQAEVLRYVQLYADPAGPFNAESISLVLRSPKDYVALDASGSPIPGASAVIPPLEKTDGVILKTLVDKYGVLPPNLLLK